MSGASTPADLMRKCSLEFGIKFVTEYGSTECSPTITLGQLSDSFENQTTTCGKVMPFVELKITNDQGQIVPNNTVGNSKTDFGTVFDKTKTGPDLFTIWFKKNLSSCSWFQHFPGLLGRRRKY